jgi:predicted DNA-binding protein
MTNRKKLDEIQNLFAQKPERTGASSETAPSLPSEPIRTVAKKLPHQEKEIEKPSGSLTESLKRTKKKQEKIRFTLDLEKPLDERLQKAANKLNRTKAEITRIALERLLNDLETEWNQ